LVLNKPGKLELVFTPKGGDSQQKWEVFDFESAGIAMGMYNTDEVFFFSI